MSGISWALKLSRQQIKPLQSMKNLKELISDKEKLKLKNLPDLLTVREVAELLRVSPLTIKRWGKRGKLVPIRINSRGDRRHKKDAVLWLLGMQGED